MRRLGMHASQQCIFGITQVFKIKMQNKKLKTKEDEVYTKSVNEAIVALTLRCAGDRAFSLVQLSVIAQNFRRREQTKRVLYLQRLLSHLSRSGEACVDL